MLERFRSLVKIACVLGMLGIVSVPAFADPVSSCDAAFTACDVYPGQALAFPGLAISGDVILLDPDGSVSDVFRIFNDIVDTGGGTGLGMDAFLYSDSLGGLPDPSTFSVNAVFIPESTVIVGGMSDTVFNGNGTDYNLFSEEPGSPIPEPSSLILLATVAAMIGGMARKRLARESRKEEL